MAIQWSLVIFTALTGAAGWMFACTACDKLAGRNADKAFITAIVALVIMVVGGCASVAHLAHPENILEALNRPSSGIFIEAALVGLSSACIAVFAILAKAGSSEGAQKAFAVLGAVFGVALSFMAGHSYMMDAIVTWNNWLLPLAYLCTAVPAGAALYLCFTAKGATAESVNVPALLMLVGGVLGAVVSLAYGAMAGFAAAAPAICLACVGGVVAAVCGYMIRKKPENTLTLAVVALACACVGAIALRVAMWQLYQLAAIGAPFFLDLSSL